MADQSRALHKAENLLLVYELDRRGALAGLTYQEIADLLHLGHRATALRLMRSLDRVKRRLEELEGVTTAQDSA